MGASTVTGAQFGDRLVVLDQKLVTAPRFTYDMCDSWPIRGVYVGRLVGILCGICGAY